MPAQMCEQSARDKGVDAMAEDFLKNPYSLFDISGKTAIVTGASGAFGSLAAKVLAGATLDLLRDPELVAAARADFEQRRKVGPVPTTVLPEGQGPPKAIR